MKHRWDNKFGLIVNETKDIGTTNNTDEIGKKFDSDKPRVAEMITSFSIPLLELCKVWEFGANKYGKDNWKQVSNGKIRYTNALLRHLLAEEEDLYDNESKLLHASHIAFNSLARLYFIAKELEIDNKPIIVEVKQSHPDFKLIEREEKND